MLGIGGSALGGSALLGSGAFSRIESQRTVDIKVAHDKDAYLGLIEKDPEDGYHNGSYVDYDDKGHLRIRLNEDNVTEGGGTGVNSNSLTFMDDMFEVRNQGKQPVTVCFDPTGLEINPNNEGDDPEEDAENVVIFYKGNAKGSNGLDGITHVHCENAEPEGYCGDELDEPGKFELPVGVGEQIGMLICTKDSSLGHSSTISGEVRIQADASVDPDQVVEEDPWTEIPVRVFEEDPSEEQFDALEAIDLTDPFALRVDSDALAGEQSTDYAVTAFYDEFDESPNDRLAGPSVPLDFDADGRAVVTIGSAGTDADVTTWIAPGELSNDATLVNNIETPEGTDAVFVGDPDEVGLGTDSMGTQTAGGEFTEVE